MLKKLILPLLMVSSMASAKDYFVGKITTQQAKDFLAGLCIGITHGAANNVLRGEEPSLIPLATFIAAHRLEAAYNGNDQLNPASLWGHGLGQFLTESIKFNYDTINKNFKIGLDKIRMNLALFFALLLT